MNIAVEIDPALITFGEGTHTIFVQGQLVADGSSFNPDLYFFE